MITRFFSTSKPIHLVLSTLCTIVLFFWIRKTLIISEFSTVFILKQISVLCVVIMSIALVSFMVNKNMLTSGNSFTVLFFALFVFTIPSALKYNSVIIANFFVLLALRRIISLKSNLNIKKKLLDASIWIAIASLFYFWSILFFALIFIALFLFAIPNLKNWIIPFFGALIIIICILTYSILTENIINDFSWYIRPMDSDFSSYNSLKNIIALTLLFSFGLWAAFFYVKNNKDKPKSMRSTHILVMYTTLIALIIIGVAPNKNGSEFLFLFAPLAIIMANFIETVSERWFAELFVWALIAVPIVGLAL